MNTSEIERLLLGKVDKRQFCAKYRKENQSLLSRKDGVVTSGDVGLSFDIDGVVVTGTQVRALFIAALDSEIDLHDARFLSNLVVLCGFDFDKECTEDALHYVTSNAVMNLESIRDAMQMLRIE